MSFLLLLLRLYARNKLLKEKSYAHILDYLRVVFFYCLSLRTKMFTYHLSYDKCEKTAD